jgi:phosphoribosyl 1,2-cyclic phosphodiesterase
MILRFWGVRGSLPTPADANDYRSKLRRVLAKAAETDVSTEERREAFIDGLEGGLGKPYGGNTPCVEARVGDDIFIFDLGSGARALGGTLVGAPRREGKLPLHIFMTHTHWDHIQGFPFFVPAYLPDVELNFYSPHAHLKERFMGQQDFRFFPVSMNYMQSKKNFTRLDPEASFEVGDAKISNTELKHPGKSYAFRVDADGASFVYASDSEYNGLDDEKIARQVEFFKGADVLIFDAHYSREEEQKRIDWGHSSGSVGVDIAVRANVKKLALFHHAPENDDFQIEALRDEAIAYLRDAHPDSALEIFPAREGDEFELTGG